MSEFCEVHLSRCNLLATASRKQALRLYQLAFLLTGQADVSADAAIEAIGLAKDGESSCVKHPENAREMKGCRY